MTIVSNTRRIEKLPSPLKNSHLRWHQYDMIPILFDDAHYAGRNFWPLLFRGISHFYELPAETGERND